MECPYIDRSFTPTPVEHNEQREFVCDDGFVYIFYNHFDGIDKWYLCQFCRLIGRKRDVFECLNESEWRACAYYLHHQSKDA